nr:hypothetical protein [uncultured Halomonas sp.]
MTHSKINDRLQGDPRYISLIIRIGARFDELVKVIHDTCDLYAKEDPPAWGLGVRKADSEWMRHALLDMWYHEHQEGQSTIKHIGAVAASNELRQAFHRVNEQKAAFQDTMNSLKTLDNRPSERVYSPVKEILAKRHPMFQSYLKGATMARLNVKQTWRRVAVLDRPVGHAGFMWSTSSRAIRRLSVAEAYAMLERNGVDHAHIQVQMRQLASIPPGEVLAQVQELAPLMRCNVRFDTEREAELREIEGRAAEEADEILSDTAALNVAMPVILPPDEFGALPTLRTPSARPQSNRKPRQKRKDVKLEPEVFLPTIHVYRYKENVAKEKAGARKTG